MMGKQLCRKHLLILVSAAMVSGLGWQCAFAAESAEQYQSPYSLRFDIPKEELLQPNNSRLRDNWKMESRVPYDQWYSRRIRKAFGCWGPDPRHYPAIAGLESRSPEWKRERVLAVAESYIGLPYQHHHIPDWDPPENWPWKEVAYGRNSKGVDCSDFTSWVYNYGLGIKLKTGIRAQAETVDIAGPGDEGQIHVHTIRNDNGYDDLVHKLKTGDLLYIKNKQGKVSHVIMWVGPIGHSPDGAPLVIDSTGPDHTDCNGKRIPIGVQLRPFLRDSWYYKSFAHAHRIIHDQA